MEEIGYLQQYVKTQEEDEFVANLTDLISKPLTLQEICRRFLRKRFGIFPQEKLRQLPLPVWMIDYLTMEGVKSYYLDGANVKNPMS